MNETTPISLEEYLQLHPADLADRLQRLDEDEARALLLQLPANKLAAALSEVEEDRQTDFLGTFDSAQLAEILTHIAPDRAAKEATEDTQLPPPGVMIPLGLKTPRLDPPSPPAFF